MRKVRATMSKKFFQNRFVELIFLVIFFITCSSPRSFIKLLLLLTPIMIMRRRRGTMKNNQK